MDESTKKSLDFQYVLDRINVITSYGQFYKKRMKPYIPGEEQKLIEELNKVEKAVVYAEDKELIGDMDSVLHRIKDLRGSIKRSEKGSILTEVELFEIKNFLFSIRDLKQLLDENRVILWDGIKIQPIQELEELLDPENTGIPTFYIYDSYSEDLKMIRQQKRNIERDIKYSLKTSDNLNLLKRKVQMLKDKEEKEEMNIRNRLTKEIAKHSKKLWMNIASIGKLDFTLGKAKFAVEIDAIKPSIVNKHLLTIIEGRHPKIEEMINEKGLEFTPISVDLQQGVACITGANMGGKTVSLKLMGLLTVMAQYGLLIPADKMILGLNNFVKSSIGDLQSIDKGLSTFGGEIKLIQEAIEISNNKGLILIDELARGTNPEEGYAITKAIVQYLLDKNSITVLTTHYDNIGNIDDITHLQVVGLSSIDLNNLETKLKDINIDKIDMISSLMDYRLMEVDKDKDVPKDAINIARIMGLDSKIIKLAEGNL
ncbi:MutS-related protein [Schnuerera sp. xch1]|uniref:lysine 5,6-aminomutase reactivase ATPase KamC n=1 Tax=Schnuerera sp. xch1 TaxID=2874283 RepID=UPI001CBB2EEE|nr:DNA mismatch repair protein MutS [Schnuerera sp. xch1]